MPDSRLKIPLDEALAAAGNACFVAMPFARRFDVVYDEIYEPTIVNCGMTAIRSDLLLSAGGHVFDEITRVLQQVRIVIVDITELNPNVLIELGIALALQRPIILFTQDDAKIPFDIQPKRVIRYHLGAADRSAVLADLQKTLRSSVHPAEASLRRMFPLGDQSRMLVLHGSATAQHIADVYPPVDEAYQRRLFSSSSETTGLWDIALALQRVALSMGLGDFRMEAADGNRCTPDVLNTGHVICLGGPGANAMFSVIADLAEQRFSNALSMRRFDHEGRSRYRVTRAGAIFPEDQDRLLDEGVDFGIVMRLRNPLASGAFLWLVAGIRSFGTQGAIRALTTPALINAVLDDGDETSECAALIRTRFDPASAQAIDWVVEHGDRLVPR